MRLLLSLSIIGSAIAVQTAAAQDPADAADGDEIVVEGRKIQKKEVDQFVRALTDTPGYGQISRFEWEVCPKVIGLLQQQNEAISRRISAVALAAGAPVAKAGCRPNIIVLVTRDAPKLLRDLRKKHSSVFRDPIGRPMPVVASKSAVAWHIEGRLNPDGLPATVADDGSTKYYMSSNMTASRLTPGTRPHFMTGVLILDLDSLGGLSPTQVADYATMRLLARTDPARLDRTSAPTILNVLDAAPDSQVPLTLTNWDFSYLKALYGTAENRFANHQRGEMQRLMRKDLQGDRPRQ